MIVKVSSQFETATGGPASPSVESAGPWFVNVSKSNLSQQISRKTIFKIDSFSKVCLDKTAILMIRIAKSKKALRSKLSALIRIYDFDCL